MVGVVPLKLTRLAGSKMSSIVRSFCWAEAEEARRIVASIARQTNFSVFNAITLRRNQISKGDNQADLGVIFLIKGVKTASTTAANIVTPAKMPKARVSTAVSFPSNNLVVRPAM